MSEKPNQKHATNALDVLLNGIKNTRCFYCTIPEVQTAEAILRAFIMDPVKAPVPPGEPVPEAAPAESVARNGKRKKQPSAK